MEAAIQLVSSKKYLELPVAERIADLVQRVQRLEDKRRSTSEMSTIIASGIVISREVNEAVAIAFLMSHSIPVKTIERVMSGKHRNSDI